MRKDSLMFSVFDNVLLYCREKAKWKEREEAWLKIENLAKTNPQVSKDFSTLDIWVSVLSAQTELTTLSFFFFLVSAICGLNGLRQSNGHGDRRAAAGRCQHAQENRGGGSNAGEQFCGSEYGT